MHREIIDAKSDIAIFELLKAVLLRLWNFWDATPREIVSMRNISEDTNKQN